MLERGEVTRSELRVRRYRVFLEEIGADCDPADVARRYEAQLRNEYAVLPGAIDLLEALRPHYRLYAVTNGSTENQKGRLQGSGVGAYFDKVFISQEVGYDKPSEAYFDHCFAHIPDFRKEETVIVGDSLSSDITGGRNAGIAAIWFSPSGQESDLPNATIRSLEELPELLRNWK
jgi:2-haloacid dehalogenase